MSFCGLFFNVTEESDSMMILWICQSFVGPPTGCHWEIKCCKVFLMFYILSGIIVVNAIVLSERGYVSQEIILTLSWYRYTGDF